MGAPGAAPSLVTETFAQHDVGTYRSSQQTGHHGHGCCQDAARFGPSARAQGKGSASLVGFGTYAPGVPTLPVMALTLRCRSWRCGCCAPRLRARARARAFMGASGQKVAMLTLTIDRSDARYLGSTWVGGPVGGRFKRNRAGKDRPRSSVMLADPRAAVVEESTRYASWAWNRFRTYLYREHGAVPFFRGVELQKSGVAHLHVLLRVENAVEVMALIARIGGPTGLAVRAGFGPVADVQLARSGGDVARYVTKANGGIGSRIVGSGRPGASAAAYVSKLPDVLPRYTRRTSWSLPNGRSPWAAGWVKPTPIAGFTWRVAKCSVATVLGALPPSDFHIVDPGSYRVQSPGHPAGGI